MRNEIRRSQIDGWLTGVDRHIALTSVKKLRRANRWLSPTVQLFPFADTDCCSCKKSRSVKNIHLCRGGDGGFLLVLDERNREQAPTLFALPKQVWYPRVKQHLHGPLERSAHSSYVFPRNAHRFCATQSEKDKTTQISKIQIYMVPCTCRRRGRTPFSLNFLSTDQVHASGRASSRSASVTSQFVKHEKAKRRQYEQRVRDVEGASFVPLVFPTSGGMARAAVLTFKRLASLLSEKLGLSYSATVNVVRCRLSFALLRSAITALRGSRRCSRVRVRRVVVPKNIQPARTKCS